MLTDLPKADRKGLVAAATLLYKSGAEPSPAPTTGHYTRAQQRQALRAVGWRGAGAKRHNVVKKLYAAHQAVLIDEALGAAKERVEHPVRSRLRRS